MQREDLVTEISMRTDIPMEEVEEVLDEEEIIFLEEEEARSKKRKICIISALLVFIAGVAATLAILNKKQKIDFEKMLDTIKDTVKSNIKKSEE